MQVEVELVDVNDEVPVWSEKHYTAVVAENTAVGSPVTQVLATDPDLGLNGLVRYQLPEPQGEVEGEVMDQSARRGFCFVVSLGFLVLIRSSLGLGFCTILCLFIHVAFPNSFYPVFCTFLFLINS